MIKKFTGCILLLLIASTFILGTPESSKAAEVMGTVNSNSVNIRAGGGLTYNVISQANKGDTFPVLLQSGGWVKISLPNGDEGWIAEYLIDVEKPAIVLTSSLNVYQEASTRTAVIGVLNKNDKVTILKEINGWYQVESETIDGWVYGNLLFNQFTVSASFVNIYKDASVRVSVIGTLTKGAAGQIIKEINGWYFIESEGKQGWIYSNHLTDGSPVKEVENSISAIVLSPKLDVYKQESMRSAIVGSIEKNVPVQIHKEVNGWYQITSGSINGWVYGGLLNSSFSVTASSINIYVEPSLRVNAIYQLQKADKGEIIKELNGWYYIKSGDKEGWIYYKHLTDGSPAAVIIINNRPAIVLSPELKVYQQESTRSALIGILNKNEPVKIQKEINGWYQITSETINGWIYGGLLNTAFSVSADSVNIYEEPSLRVYVIEQLQKAETGEIIKEINGWYYIKSGDKEGWIYYKHLTEGSPAGQAIIKDEEAIVLIDDLEVYEEASTRTAVIGHLDKDLPVTIKRTINGWYQIVSPELKGWVYGNLLKSNVITVPNKIDVYLNSTTRTTIVTTLRANTHIKIVKELNGWYFIQSDYADGWIYKTHLENGSPELTKLLAKVIIDSYITYEPSSNSEVIGAIVANQEIYVTREVNGFYEVINDNGRGWVPVSQVSLYKLAPLTGKTIVLDAGHGGSDSGALSQPNANGERSLEKYLTLRTVLLLQKKLKSLGANVILTRSSDVYMSLADRVKVSENNKADAFVSIHYNSSISSTATGIETLYYHDKDIPLAQSLQSSLMKYIDLRDRSAHYQDVHVLRENSQPGALVELGFISNPMEEYLIQTTKFQENATTAIAEGVISYFSKLN